MAVFISFEGGEGSGKSTQAEILTNRLRDCGFAVEFVHEPGSTELGWRVRQLLKRGLSREQFLTAHAELLLFSAARVELVFKMLQPLLDIPNSVIVADRYVDSTTAYQGYGRGIPLDQVEVVNALATQGIMPHLTFLLDIPPIQGIARIGGIQLGFQFDDRSHFAGVIRTEEGARFEEEPMEFHERVREGYLKLKSAEPERWETIDATKSESEISDQIWEEVCGRFPEIAAVTEGAKR